MLLCGLSRFGGRLVQFVEKQRIALAAFPFLFGDDAPEGDAADQDNVRAELSMLDEFLREDEPSLPVWREGHREIAGQGQCLKHFWVVVVKGGEVVVICVEALLVEDFHDIGSRRHCIEFRERRIGVHVP